MNLDELNVAFDNGEVGEGDEEDCCALGEVVDDTGKDDAENFEESLIECVNLLAESQALLELIHKSAKRSNRRLPANMQEVMESNADFLDDYPEVDRDDSTI